MKSQIVVLGLGGQGILFLTRVVAEAAIDEGHDVITAETHGMAQRGGAVESHLKIGGFESPLVRLGRADAALALDPSREDAAKGYGGVFVGATREFGRSSNLFVLGRACAEAPKAFPRRDALVRAIERLSPPKALEANRRAFLAGCP